MCGLTGYWSQAGNLENLEAIACKMSNTIIHRGPDSKGTWVDPTTGIALGHRRLAIVDLSPEGHQPMHSANDRYILVFNGEIYNFRDLQQQLLAFGHSFRGHSDTEVMLAAFCQWGIEPAVQKFVGMFAFALWDRQERVLHLGRDRLGEKPLYYGWMGDTFLFGSELKALKAHPHWQGKIDRDVLTLLLRHNYIPAPYSIYQNIYKLPPGTLLTLPTANPSARPTPKPYWSMQSVVESGRDNPFQGSEREAVAQLDSLLRDAISQQIVADVPLGAFLSGGVDSSTVVALMQAQSSRPVKTFTIGFHEAAYNEANDAKVVARHLGTDHTELYVTPEEALAVIPKLPALYDEPFSDSSQIPTFLVSQLARQHVTVSLSGDGGDELFGGYNRYFLANRIWKQVGWLPQNLKSTIARGLTLRSPEAWNKTFEQLAPILPKSLRQRLPGDKLHKLAAVLAVDSPEALYTNLVSHWSNPAALVLGASEPPTALTDSTHWANLPDFTQQMMYLDAVTYLPGDILTKVDRAAMGVSLETRVPFLDHRVVEFTSTLPLALKIRQSQSKWLLRQVLYQYVPPKLIERPKMGFGIPLDRWLRNELRDWAEDLLSEQRLEQEGFFNPQPIRQKWQEHLSGTRNWQYHLWDVLMFQSWLEAQ
ncbi:asparagine synthase (glutamine-hydrolyzing) [Oscillatoria sp. FACHB-1406]|uniref:asparagine synthase (glutamine-hydrolyzing) n=1 Tax=Oscillatoria sp. FACHB-1406 TaxID=2692846 RepID=UPI0016832E83|nr:asparagine synthase (glutamine-hydrolyzing) [Oscillatoria sp. FACHB-1406]MBD2577195.1 asparagine synthase (glutamine-hydrolyzing) [Oscillatoria sp. FACHB-1406]